MIWLLLLAYLSPPYLPLRMAAFALVSIGPRFWPGPCGVIPPSSYFLAGMLNTNQPRNQTLHPTDNPLRGLASTERWR